ncbi:cytochrome P450, partial [Tanacetum coccineum]
MGDFNEVRYDNERKGSIFNTRGATRFNKFISSSGLVDLPIDRILVSQHVVDLWPDSHTITLPREFSDHYPLLLSNLGADYGPIPFKLYNSWLQHKEFPSIVHNNWNSMPQGPLYNVSLHPSVSFKSKLQRLKSNIKIWRQK